MALPGVAGGVSARRIHLYANGCRRRVVSGLRRRIHANGHGAPSRGLAHEGSSRTVSTTHLRDSDGHVLTWRLPAGLYPVWGWFGGGAYSAATFDSLNFYKQTPWWWVLADREG